MTNELSGWVQTVGGVVTQIHQLPYSVLIVLVLILMGGALKAIAAFPNRFIPWLIILLFGPALNILFGFDGGVNPEIVPKRGLALQGVAIGLFSWLLHVFVLKRFEKYLPFLAGKSGDTVTIRKDSLAPGIQFDDEKDS